MTRRLGGCARGAAALGSLMAAVLVISAGPPATPPATAQGTGCAGDFEVPRQKLGGPPLVMGIYPGGLAGQIGAPKPPKPEDPAKRLGALEQLRGDREFAVHLYVKFSGDGKSDADNARIERELRDYMRRGFVGELVVTYRPAARRGAPDVDDFVRYTREVVRRLGPERNFRSIQVTNEVTNSLSPDASDGSFPGAKDALIQGIVAAKDEARRGGFAHLEVGFNWLYRLDPKTERDFWTYLGQHGGPRFLAALDWVGVDAYPGTFYPPGNPPGGERTALVNAFSVLRECYLPMAGIPPAVPLHISENGYPTGPGRTYEEQERMLRSMVGTVDELRGNYNITDYRWFDLRDGDSSDPDFGQQYGLMRDDYSAKPAFAAFRELIASRGAPRTARSGRVGARRCLPRRGRVTGGAVLGVMPGTKRSAVRRRLGPPTRSTRRSDRWCVVKGGQVRVAYGAGRARVVLTSARGHRLRRRGIRRAVGRGTPVRVLRRLVPSVRAAGSRRLRHRRVVFGSRRGRVRYVAVADPRVARRERRLRAYLRRAAVRSLR